MEARVLVIDGSGRTDRRIRTAVANLQAREQAVVTVHTCADAPSEVQGALSSTPWDVTLLASLRVPLPLPSTAGRVFLAPERGARQDTQLGWLPAYSGIDILLWLQRGAAGVVDPSDAYSAAILTRILRPPAPSTRLILGEGPVAALDDLHTEMTDCWLERIDQFEPRRRLIWRTAFALAQLAPLDDNLTSWAGIADTLISRAGWFAHNRDDVRKALGKLGTIWECEAKARHYLAAAEARRRGFPASPPIGDEFDILLDQAEDIDVSGQTLVTGIDADYRELILSV